MTKAETRVVIYDADGKPHQQTTFSLVDAAVAYASRKREEIARRGWNMSVRVYYA